MSEPYMPLYVGDYLRDTRHLTTEQHGAYLLLLMTMWAQGGRLPNDPVKLARVAGMQPRRWQSEGQPLMEFFRIEGEWITHKRLDRERQKVISISGKRKAAGKMSAAAKALRNMEAASANATTDAEHMHQQSSTIHNHNQLDSTDRTEDTNNNRGSRSQNGAGEYAFEYGCIRLIQRDLDRWKKSFPNVNVEAELTASESWLAQQHNWFQAAAGLLNKRQREATQRGPPTETRRREKDPLGNWVDVET